MITISLAFSSPANQLESSECYTRGEELTVTPTATFTGGEDPSLHLLEYTVLQPDGTEIVPSVQSVLLNAADLTTSFTLSNIGGYTVQISVTNTTTSEVVFTGEVSIQTCNFIVIEYLECNKFSISNRSLDTVISYTIEEIGSTTTTPAVLAAGSAVNVSFDNVSMFILHVEYNGTLEQYILNNYCVLEDCIAKYIEDIMCEDTNRCNPCPDEIELNQMLLLSYVYFMKVHKEYSYNNFYSGLSASKLAEITDIEDTMEKLKTFCKRRGCLATTSSYSIEISTPYSWKYDSNCSSCGGK